MLRIHSVPNPILTQVCESGPVNFRHVSEMFTLMKVARGVGLAAPQVGINRRFFITNWGEIFVDPKIEWVSGVVFDSNEGCLSIPGKRFIVPRFTEIRVFGKTYHGQQAVVIAHELDHLNGILISRGTLVE